MDHFGVSHQSQTNVSGADERCKLSFGLLREFDQQIVGQITKDDAVREHAIGVESSLQCL